MDFARRKLLSILLLACSSIIFQSSDAQLFIGDDEAPGILWTALPDPKDDTMILSSYHERYDLITLSSGSRVTDIAFDRKGSMVYWCDYTNQKISRIPLRNNNPELLISASGPVTISLDMVNEKIYWTSYTTKTINRASLDGTRIEPVHSTSDNPFTIAFDLPNNYMYFSSRTDGPFGEGEEGSIGRTDLDGNDQQTIKAQNAPDAVFYEQCSNPSNGRLYYFSKSSTLGFIDFDIESPIPGQKEVTLQVVDRPPYYGRTINKYGSKVIWTTDKNREGGLGISVYDHGNFEYYQPYTELTLQDNSIHYFQPRSVRIFLDPDVTYYDEPVAIENCPENDIDLHLEKGSDTRGIWWPAPKLNSWSSCSTWNITSDYDIYDNVLAGTYFVSYHAWDANGNTDSCEITINVNEYDDDECKLNTDNCDANALCTNTQGSFTCTCNSGYSGNGTICSDDDECTLNTHDCDANAVCTNTPPGTFTCTCNEGYTGNGTVCTDIDECTLDTDDCDTNALCTNTPAGSFTCTCNNGYSGNGTTCTAESEEQPTTQSSMGSSASASSDDDCGPDQSGKGTTFFSFSQILQTIGIAFMFIITLQ